MSVFCVNNFIIKNILQLTMSQPRKRRRVSESLKDEVKEMFKEMVAEAIPTIASAVVAQLQQNTSATGPVHTVCQTTSVEDDAIEQQQQTLDNANQVPDSIVSTPSNGNLRNITGPLQAGRPLGQGIDVKVKSKIWAEEYIQLGSLNSAKLEAVQGKDNSFTFQQKEHKYYFKNLQQWMNAFHIFVAVYCEKCPAQAPCLMKYMAMIQKLSNDVGEKAAFYYDEQFRIWRAENPAQMPWEKINAELHMEALQVGLKSRLDGQEKTSKQKSFQQQPFRGKSKKPCFSYNNNNGNCTRPSCEYAHICSRCFGEHSKKDCHGPSESNKRIYGTSNKQQNPTNQIRK